MSFISLVAAIAVLYRVSADGPVAPWPAFAGGPAGRHTSRFTPLHDNLAETWAFSTGMSVVATPILSSTGILYVGSYSSVFYALNASDGKTIWQYATDFRVSSPSAALSSDESSVFLAGSDSISVGVLRCFNSFNGSLMWHASGVVGSAFLTAPVVSFSLHSVFVGASNGCLYRFDQASGSVVWTQCWSQAIESTPALDDARNILYFGSVNTVVYGVSAGDGNVLWHFTAGHHVSSSPALSLDCSLVFIGSWGKSVYGLNATTGGLVWKHELLGFVSQSPALSPDGQLLYIGSEGGDFTALSSLTGATVWNRPSSQPNSVRTATVGSDNSVLVATYDRNLYCFNGSSGDQLWLLSFANSVSGSAVIGEDGYVYVGSSDTKVHCFRSAPVVQPSTMPSVTGSRTSTVTPSHAPPPLTGLALLCTRVCL